MNTPRTARMARNTQETRIIVELGLDGTGVGQSRTAVPFFDHMLDQIRRHALLDLDVSCQGDNHIDDHHSVEDTGITFGQALRAALGDMRGVSRFGHAYAPLDEALARVVIDLSGRPGLYYHVAHQREQVGQFDTELVAEFFQGFVNHAGVTLHIDSLRADNEHHRIESVFKAFARALRMACAVDPRLQGQLASTKEHL